MFKTIACECDLKALRDAIVEVGLKEAIAETPDITVFGPTNKAFKKFQGCDQVADLQSLLLYHVLGEKVKLCKLKSGTDKKYPTLLIQDEVARKVRVNVYSCPTFNNVTTVNGTIVVDEDIKAKNGVLHKIKRVLCPPAGTIAAIAAGNPEFSILVTALEVAGLLAPGSPLLDPEAGLTVFAPTNAAFEALLVERGITLEQLLENPNLGNILLYHVVGQTVFSPAIKQGKTKGISTLDEGNSVSLVRCCDKILVRDNNKRMSKVILPDVLAENGVIHAVDKVLLP